MTIARLNRTYQSQFWPGGTNPAVSSPIFTFDPVAPGSVWTGTISITTAAVLTPGSNSANPQGVQNHNDMLVNMIWTLYRNGSPEMTWIGLSQAVNVQLYSNDVVVVIGTLPLPGVVVALTNTNPINLACSYVGYSADESEVHPLVPYVTGSTQASPYEPLSFPGDVQVATILNKSGTGTVNFGLTSAGNANFLRIWSAWIVLGVNNAASNVTSASIRTGNGAFYFTNSVMGSGNVSNSLDLGSGPMLVPVGFLPLQLQVFDAVGASTASNTMAGITYTFDTLV